MAGFNSYGDLLTYVCKEFQPRNVLEYGPGGSTAYFLEYSEAYIHSIEHEYRWYDKALHEFAERMDRLALHYIKEHDEYVSSDFGLKYDIVFVDGLCDWRVDCLLEAPKKLSPEGLVILHDSERKKYEKGTRIYDELLTIKGTTLYEPLIRV